VSSKDRMLARAARDIEPGMTVNLGIGLPTQVMSHVPADCPVCLHSENGIAGVGGLAPAGEANRNLIDAGGGYITCAAGGSFFDSAVSFALVRGGRLDLTLLGAFEVAANGDLANWIIPGKFAAGVGGAIELAQKAKRVGVLTTHTDKHGNPKILERCTLPLTAVGCVHRIYTDMAVCDVMPDGLHLIELAEGVTLAQVLEATGAPLVVADGPIPVF